MSSASLQLKEFKALFPRMVRAIEKATGRKKDDDVQAILVFPVVRALFAEDPAYCKDVANGNLHIGTWNHAKQFLPDMDVQVTDEMMTQLRPIMMELAMIFYKYMPETTPNEQTK